MYKKRYVPSEAFKLADNKCIDVLEEEWFVMAS